MLHRSEGFIPLRGYVSPRVRGRWGVGHRREFFRRRTIYPPSPRENEENIRENLPKIYLKYTQNLPKTYLKHT